MSIWVPGAVVLAVGLAAGVFIALRLRRSSAAEPAQGAAALELADLEARRDELFAKLRDLGDEASAADRELLERAAARTLRDLDRAGARLEKSAPGVKGKKRRAVAAAADAPPAPAPPAVGGRSFAAGFLYGAGLFLLLGALVYWALRDAAPRPEEGMSAPVSTAQERPHPETDQLPPELSARIAELERLLAADPDDLSARKEIAYLMLDSGQFFEAFKRADEVLGRRPEDPDALYIQGIVRLTMGQRDAGAELVGRALAADPEHVPSLIARGILRLQEGDRERAVAAWERGLAAAGGRHPGLERLLAETRAGKTAEEILGGPAPAPAPETAAAPAPQPAAAPPPAASPAPAPVAVAADTYDVRIELAPGASAPPGATLFVFLRGAGGGPPVAVRRISGAAFPIELVLGPEDSMMGAELPSSGILVARLDADGSASTSGPEDLAAEAAASGGGSTTLVLDR